MTRMERRWRVAKRGDNWIVIGQKRRNICFEWRCLSNQVERPTA